MRCSVEGTRVSCRKMFEAMRPGLTENQLWGVLWAELLARHGEWMEWLPYRSTKLQAELSSIKNHKL